MTGQQPRHGYAAGALQPRGARLALAAVATGAQLQRGGETYFLQISDAAADLSLLNQHAPFLLEHHHFLEDLLGDVGKAGSRTASSIASCASAIAARRPGLVLTGARLQDRLLSRVRDHRRRADPRRAGLFRVTRWLATEISASVIIGGADPRASITWQPFAELVERTERQREVRLEVERARRLRALRADSWRHWASNGAAGHRRPWACRAPDRAAPGRCRRAPSRDLARAVERLEET